MGSRRISQTSSSYRPLVGCAKGLWLGDIPSGRSFCRYACMHYTTASGKRCTPHRRWHLRRCGRLHSSLVVLVFHCCCGLEVLLLIVEQGWKLSVAGYGATICFSWRRNGAASLYTYAIGIDVDIWCEMNFVADLFYSLRTLPSDFGTR